MSLEKAIEENTAAVRELIKLFSGARIAVSQEAQTVKPEEQAIPQAAAAAAKPVAEVPKNVDALPVDAAAIAKAATALVQKKGRAAAEAILAKYKLKKFSDANPSEHAKLYADIAAAQVAA